MLGTNMKNSANQQDKRTSIYKAFFKVGGFGGSSAIGNRDTRTKDIDLNKSINQGNTLGVFNSNSSAMKKNSMIIQKTTSIDNIRSIQEVRLPVEMENKLKSMLSNVSFNNISILYKYAKTAINFEKYKKLIEHFIENKANWTKFYFQEVEQSFKYGPNLSLPI